MAVTAFFFERSSLDLLCVKKPGVGKSLLCALSSAFPAAQLAKQESSIKVKGEKRSFLVISVGWIAGLLCTECVEQIM